MRYAFKDRYTDYQGTDVERAFNTRFYAYAGTGTAATRQNPTRSNGTIAATYGQNQSIILGGGYHKFSVGTTSAPVNQNNLMFRIIGHGMKASVVDAILYEGHQISSGTFDGVFLKDVTVKSIVTYRLGYNGQGTYYNKYYQCEILALPTMTNVGVNITNLYDRCIFRVNPSSGTINANNSFIGAVISTIPTTQQQLFENCDVYLSSADILSNRTQYYFAFDRCRFRIIGESDYTELQGNTPDEMRADFVARCVAQGYNPPDNTEFGITNKFYRWVFTRNSCFESIIPKGSDIYLFEVLRGISLGAASTRSERIGVTTEPNAPATFSPAFPNTGSLDFQPAGLYLPDTDDITDLHFYSAMSNIISFGQKKQLTRLMLVDSLPAIYGVKADSTQDLFSNSPISPGGTISPGVFYVLRSSDKQPATISYNGATYSTSLNTRDNLVLGVAAASTYTAVSGNPVFYQVYDELQYKTLQIRVVNKIPADIIRTGALLAGYWYTVEHDSDQGNTTDYVTYNGVKYYAGSSFLVVTGVTGFTVTGSIHLRRCWKDIFNFDTETVDKNFWENQQKPEWVDVADGDPRCLLKNNLDLAHEMARDALGKYIASGHPDFYKSITGDAGILMKPMPIKGAYMQARIVISTLNIM